MRRSLSMILAVGLTVAACNSSSEEGTTTSAEVVTSAPTTEAAETPTTTSPEEATTTTPASAGGPECLVGTWLVDTDSYVETLTDVFAEAGMGAESLTSNDGTYTIELVADGSLTGARENWGFAIVMAEGTFNITINGTEAGTWSADDNAITVDVADSDMTVTATVEVEGETITLPESPVPIPETIASDSDYSCDGDTLTVTNEGVTSVMTRA